MSYTGSKAQSANQVAININTGTVTTPVWTLVGEVEELAQSGFTNKTADVTNLQSTAEEFIATILGSGKFAGTMNRVSSNAGQAAALTSFTGATNVEYQVQLPKTGSQTIAGDSFTFLALVEEFNDISTIKPDGAVKTQFGLKVSGPLTRTAGS